ncbi:proximal sequence element A Pbp49 [Lycorma delicatula]|uniref:proximal sequence element A Pbp49 n=1 Tax=Lycorma delicatula TaxID=130591 RepID=UPI003F510A6D
MEAIYLKGNTVDWATEKVHLNQYFNKFSNVTKDSFSDVGTDPKTIASHVGFPFTDEQLYALSETCSPNLLAVEGENPIVNVDTVYHNPTLFDKTEIPSDIDLECFKLLKNRSKLQEDYIYSRLKYKNQIHLNDECRKLKADIPLGKEFIVTIRVHFPFHTSPDNYAHKKTLSCSQEIVLTAVDTLDKLRDVIICMEEFGDTSGDVSEMPDAPVKVRLKDVYKSGMFYIGNTFYVDKRYPENLDYSEVIRSWAAKRKITMNRVDVMEKTKISDLVVRFGYPYLYQHLGNCEHLFIFSDARLLHQNDIQTREQYPLYMSLSVKLAKFCTLCGSNVARWVVTNFEKLTRDPAFVCTLCFKMYFYIGKKKNGSFQAFRYYDRRAMI